MSQTQAPENVEDRIQTLIKRLRQRGHRITPQRLAILREFLSDTSHPTAEQIFARLHDLFPTMALTTVHNTLRLLVEMGEAMEITPSAPAARFDPRAADHCHLICVKCERIIDLNDCDTTDWNEIAKLAKQAGFEPFHQVHEVYGLCPECRRSSSSNH